MKAAVEARLAGAPKLSDFMADSVPEVSSGSYLCLIHLPLFSVNSIPIHSPSHRLFGTWNGSGLLCDFCF